jgi:hypothetical protein
MGFRQDKGLAGDNDDPLIWPAGRTGRQIAFDFGCNISPDNGEVAVFELEDVRAALQTWSLRAA